jgi:hypothetical protein
MFVIITTVLQSRLLDNDLPLYNEKGQLTANIRIWHDSSNAATYIIECGADRRCTAEDFDGSHRSQWQP